ncbi:hypothetical protein ACEQ8H_005676 [Pleosporales sp. CAS-2024a]
MAQQARERRQVKPWQITNINKHIATHAQVSRYKKSEKTDGLVRNRDKHSEEDDSSRNDHRSSTPPRYESGNMQQLQSASSPLLDRTTKDSKLLSSPGSPAEIPQSSSSAKRKRGDDQNINLDRSKRARHSDTRLDTPAVQVEYLERSSSCSRGREEVRYNKDGRRKDRMEEKTFESHSQQSAASTATNRIASAKMSLNKQSNAHQSNDDERRNQRVETTATLKGNKGPRESPLITQEESDTVKNPPKSQKVTRKAGDIDLRPDSNQSKQGVNKLRQRVPLLETEEPRPQKKKKKKEKQQPQKPAREPCAQDAFASNPVATNHACPHVYKHYNNDSIPLLSSTEIQHSDNPDVLNEPSIKLKADAMLLLQSGIRPEDLGRKEMERKGRSKVIESVDLYLHEDGKIYVATELGLLLAADYLRLAGIPETQNVRFNGVKPAWVRATVARATPRRTIVQQPQQPAGEDKPDFYDKLRKYQRIPPAGDLGLWENEMVDVYFTDEESGRSFGQRLDKDAKMGWFKTEHVGEFESLDSPDWNGVYNELDLWPDVTGVFVPGEVEAKEAARIKAQALEAKEADAENERRKTQGLPHPLPRARRATPDPYTYPTPKSRCTTPALPPIMMNMAGKSPICSKTAAASSSKTTSPNSGTPLTPKPVPPHPSTPLSAATLTSRSAGPLTSPPVAVATKSPAEQQKASPKEDQSKAKADEQVHNSAQTVKEPQAPDAEQAEKQAKNNMEDSKADEKPQAGLAAQTEIKEDPVTATAPEMLAAPVQCPDLYSGDVEDEVDWEDDEL